MARVSSRPNPPPGGDLFNLPRNMTMNWLPWRKPALDKRAARAAGSNAPATVPMISSRRARRMEQREKVFGVVRESMIRAGMISSSYSFKVLALDAEGKSFLVLMDTRVPEQDLTDTDLLEIEQWMQSTAHSRHAIRVKAVYWRRDAKAEQTGVSLRATMDVQAHRESALSQPAPLLPEAAVASNETEKPTTKPGGRRPIMQTVSEDEVEAFRQALAQAAAQRPNGRTPGVASGESHSDFAALSETQYGKL